MFAIHLQNKLASLEAMLVETTTLLLIYWRGWSVELLAWLKRLSQLRLGCLPIRIESDRYTRPIVHRDLRYCLQPKCKNVANNLDDNLKDVENEFHFLIVCSQYDSLRNVLYSKIESPSFATMTDHDKFVYLLTTPSVAKIVAQFIVDALDDRPVKM